jgi:DNA transposition AAA+ family ATPase
MTDHDASKILNDYSRDARQLRAARMLPVGLQLSDLDHLKVRELCNEHIVRYGIAQKTIADQIGMSPGVVSEWCRGVYGGDMDKLTRRMNAWLESDARMRHANIDIPYVTTWLAEAMTSMINLACDRQSMLAIVAPSGTGKTMVIKASADRRRGFCVYCDEHTTTKNFLEALSRAVLPEPKARSIPAMRDELINKLRGTRRPVHVDEAHLLRKPAFGVVRSIFDQTGVPFIFVGTQKIIERIDDSAGGDGQFYRRCRMWNAIEHIINLDNPGSTNAGRPLFSLQEVQEFLSHQDVKLTSDSLEMLWGLACIPGKGSLGIVRELVGTCYCTFGPGAEIGMKQLVAMMQALFGGAETVIMTGMASDYVHAMQRTA